MTRNMVSSMNRRKDISGGVRIKVCLLTNLFDSKMHQPLAHMGHLDFGNLFLCFVITFLEGSLDWPLSCIHRPITGCSQLSVVGSLEWKDQLPWAKYLIPSSNSMIGVDCCSNTIILFKLDHIYIYIYHWDIILSFFPTNKVNLFLYLLNFDHVI